jgi:hypothetical protein
MKPTLVDNEARGARILEAIQNDVKDVGESMIEALLAQVEETEGLVDQSVSVTVKYKHPAGGEDYGTMEVMAKLTSKGGSLTRATRIAAPHGKRGRQLSMFSAD